jgi:hypothetical protein
MSCSNFRLPCFRFIAALLVTMCGLIFGCLMLGLGKAGDLSAFYTSLISTCISFWASPPKYNNEVDNTLDINHI